MTHDKAEPWLSDFIRMPKSVWESATLLMRFTYDPRYKIAYIRFQEKRVEVETIRVSDELIVDITPDGTVYGIELLNADEQLRREDGGKLLLINEATNERTELSLPIGRTTV